MAENVISSHPLAWIYGVKYMMKAFIVCCVLLGVLQVEANPLSNNQKLILEGYHKDCLNKSKVDGDIMDKMGEGGFSDDPSFKNYIYCFSTRLSFFNDHGIIQKDIVKKHLSKLVEDEALLTNILKQCTVQKSSPQETSFYLAKCMREVDPNLNLYKQVFLAGKEKEQQLFPVQKHCADEHFGLDDQVIDQALKTKFLKDYIDCFSRQTGFLHKNGSIDKVGFKKSLGNIIHDPDTVRRLVEQCSQSQKTPEDTFLFMLKCVSVNYLVNYTAYVEPFPHEISIPKELAIPIYEHSRACIEETKVDRDIFQQARFQGIFQDDAKLKEFCFCIAKKAGLINDAGEIQRYALKEKTLKIFDNMDIVMELIDKCAIQRSEGAVETAFRAAICLQKNAPRPLRMLLVSLMSYPMPTPHIDIDALNEMLNPN